MGLSSMGSPSPDRDEACGQMHWRYERVMYASAGKSLLLSSFLMSSVTLAFCLARLDQTDLLRPFSISSLHVSVLLGFGSVLTSAFLWMMSSRPTASASTTVVAHLRFTLWLASITFVLALIFLAHAFFAACNVLSGDEYKEQTSR